MQRFHDKVVKHFDNFVLYQHRSGIYRIAQDWYAMSEYLKLKWICHCLQSEFIYEFNMGSIRARTKIEKKAYKPIVMLFGKTPKEQKIKRNWKKTNYNLFLKVTIALNFCSGIVLKFDFGLINNIFEFTFRWWDKRCWKLCGKVWTMDLSGKMDL